MFENNKFLSCAVCAYFRMSLETANSLQTLNTNMVFVYCNCEIYKQYCDLICRQNSRHTVLQATLHCTKQQHILSYPEGDFEAHSSAGATRCTDGSEIWSGEVLHAKFHPLVSEGTGPPKLKILPKFYQISEHKCPTGAYPLHDFYEICSILVCFTLQMLFKFGWISLRGSGTMGICS